MKVQVLPDTPNYDTLCRGNMRLLGDADGWVYKYGFSAQKKQEPILETDDVVWIVEPFHHVVNALQRGLKKHMDLAGCDSYELYLTGPGNFRYAVYPTYKANRMEMQKPFYYNEIRSYMVNVLDAEIVEGMEADDKLAIEQTADPEGTVICTEDKDLDQIAGWKYNYVKELLYYVTPEEAEFNLWSQVLTGDRVDNIPGLSGIGPVRAEKILNDREDEESYGERVQRAYMEHYMDTSQGLEEFQKNFKLVRLLIKNPEEDVPW